MDHTMPIGQFLMSFLSPMKVEERQGTVSSRLQVYLSNGRYILDSANANYSFGGLHAVFRKVFARFGICKRDIGTALILGFGAGSVASILCHECHKPIHLTGVEKDPVVIDLAKKYFRLDRYKHLTLHVEDAGDFVERCEQKFDLVVVDIFAGLDVPPQFWEEKFLAGLGRLLAPRGISFFNVVVYDEKVRGRCASLFEKMESLIGKTECCAISLTQTQNWLFVCDRTKPHD